MRILGFCARVSGPPTLVAQIRQFQPAGPAWAAVASAPEVEFTVGPAADRPGYLRIAESGGRVWVTRRRSKVLPYLVWRVLVAGLDHLRPRYLMFHGGAVAYQGRGLILPAASHSGKTTLTAGLLADGFSYYSDDVVAVDPETLTLLPFAKCLCVKPGARKALLDRFPQLEGGVPRLRYGREWVWYLPPDEDRWGPPGVPIRYVVLPRYVRGSRTELAAIRRSEALAHLYRQSYSLRKHGEPGTARLIDALRDAECYRLRVGELDEAIRLLGALVRSG